MFFKRDFSDAQFANLQELYDKAVVQLNNLENTHPEHQSVWKIVNEKLKIIKETLNNDELPSDNRKRDADLSTMLTYEFRDYLSEDMDLSPLYRVDQAFTLLGMKDITFSDPSNQPEMK